MTWLCNMARTYIKWPYANIKFMFLVHSVMALMFNVRDKFFLLSEIWVKAYLTSISIIIIIVFIMCCYHQTHKTVYSHPTDFHHWIYHFDTDWYSGRFSVAVTFWPLSFYWCCCEALKTPGSSVSIFNNSSKCTL